jgi:aspartyl-tRNA(Asn)/glutamyl-tRNA(Gln) amidotransferase subunit C
MSQIPIDIDNLSKLSRIQCDENEKEDLLKSLSNIIGYMDSLNEIDTTNVKPSTHVLESIYNVFREDEVKETLSRDTFLANAPAHTAGMIKVPIILKNT